MYTQSNAYYSGEGIYDNVPNEVNYNMNAPRGFAPIATFTRQPTLIQLHESPSLSRHPSLYSFDANRVPEVIRNPATFGALQSNNMLSNGNGNSSVFNSEMNYLYGGKARRIANRETGIVGKMLKSYGFIQCCDRQGRLFFHFSEFMGQIDQLKIGNAVEFELTHDRVTGKPIASKISKVGPNVVLSKPRVLGTVATELRTEPANNLLSPNETIGRISYDIRGECFFLLFTKDDVENNANLRSGDTVSFQISSNHDGDLSATNIRMADPAHAVKYRGAIYFMKSSFGFIERPRLKPIFFHFSETMDNFELRPGDDVEFTIQMRNGRECACNITRLPPGTVVFH